MNRDEKREYNRRYWLEHKDELNRQQRQRYHAGRWMVRMPDDADETRRLRVAAMDEFKRETGGLSDDGEV